MAEQQASLFDPPSNTVNPPATKRIEPIAAPADDTPRLTGQNGKIYEMLQIRPHTNNELVQVSLKYTSRISDIRKWLTKHRPGWDIVCTKCGGGLNSYSLDGPESN